MQIDKKLNNNPLNIAFLTPHIDVRGTCIALYDYAHYNEEILGNKSTIFVPLVNLPTNDYDVTEKFIKRFGDIVYYTDFEEHLDDFDVLYVIKYGKNDGVYSKKIKTCIHCVFDMSEPHGNVYAAVSSTLAKKFGSDLYVSHMAGLKPSKTKENMRKELNIPIEATVFGRIGGRDTFDLMIAKNAIIRAVNSYQHIYFIFVNTPIFYVHPNIIHIEKIIDLDEKNKFICTCDATIHAQSLGETHGQGLSEFSVNNKPVITYGGKVWNDHYKTILGDDGAIYYYNEEECYEKLIYFNKKDYEKRDNNYYKDYMPEVVIKQFEQVFLK